MNWPFKKKKTVPAPEPWDGVHRLTVTHSGFHFDPYDSFGWDCSCGMFQMPMWHSEERAMDRWQTDHLEPRLKMQLLAARPLDALFNQYGA